MKSYARTLPNRRDVAFTQKLDALEQRQPFDPDRAEMA